MIINNWILFRIKAFAASYPFCTEVVYSMSQTQTIECESVVSAIACCSKVTLTTHSSVV